MNTETEITDYLSVHPIYSKVYFDHGFLPNNFCKNKDSVKAVVLGCDPSFVKNNRPEQITTVFNLDDTVKENFFSTIKDNLDEINLGLDQIYVQNLCRNYFTKETQSNDYWIEIARLWIPALKNELDALFNINIPVLLTSGHIYTALLGHKIKATYSYKGIYEKCTIITSNDVDNPLRRDLIPFFRHKNYKLSLEKWTVYKDKIRKKLELA